MIIYVWRYFKKYYIYSDGPLSMEICVTKESRQWQFSFIPDSHQLHSALFRTARGLGRFVKTGQEGEEKQGGEGEEGKRGDLKCYTS